MDMSVEEYLIVICVLVAVLIYNKMKNSYSNYIPYQLAFFDNLCQKNLEKIVNLKNRLFALFLDSR